MGEIVINSAYHQLRIVDTDGVRQLKFERNQQSTMMLEDIFETTMEYLGYMLIALAAKPDAARVLVIGLGGGSLVKRLWRDYPHMVIDAVELDPDVVQVAICYFGMPENDERIRVTVGDGREFVQFSEETYDIIFVDAFDDDRVPRLFVTEEFMRECRDILAPDGVIAWNVFGAVYGAQSRQFRSFYRTARNVWRHVWAFPIAIAEDPNDFVRNVVMLASDADVSDDELAERIASRVGGLVTVPAFERCAEDFYRKPIRGGDVPILSDEDSSRGGREGGASRRR